MPLRFLLGFFIALAFATTPTFGTIMAPPAPTDPPIYISNQSAAPVKVVWQTVWPHKALSPQREATVPAGAADLKADRGVFWYVDPASGKAVDNMVFVSVVGTDGKQLSQSVLDEAIADSLAVAEAKALHVTVGADLAIELSAK